jgi:hypothetical protein
MQHTDQQTPYSHTRTQYTSYKGVSIQQDHTRTSHNRHVFGVIFSGPLVFSAAQCTLTIDDIQQQMV